MTSQPTTTSGRLLSPARRAQLTGVRTAFGALDRVAPTVSARWDPRS